MVKNTKGGSKHKKMARKMLKEDETQQATRYANEAEENEMYAVVIKMYGNGMCGVRCNDGKERLCIIRNKFRGRNKKSNMIGLDTVVLVGIRDWEVVHTDTRKKKNKCDLLEVYTDQDVHRLKKLPAFTLFQNPKTDDYDGIDFVDTDASGNDLLSLEAVAMKNVMSLSMDEL